MRVINGERIANIRKDRSLTQVELASLSDLSQQTISALERGDMDDISVSRLARIASVLEVSVCDLLYDHEDRATALPGDIDPGLRNSILMLVDMDRTDQIRTANFIDSLRVSNTMIHIRGLGSLQDEQ
ncbi:MAG: helix-turn-helix transcriptional regulator [Chloroflexota bacterium]